MQDCDDHQGKYAQVNQSCDHVADEFSNSAGSIVGLIGLVHLKLPQTCGLQAVSDKR